jgi:uncharacterized membrane protein
MRLLAALLLLIASTSQAFAVINICNKFKYAIFVAMAYPTVDGWRSRGWAKVDPNQCRTDPKFEDLTGFYYRGETDPIDTGDGKTMTWSWGNNRSFTVANDDFQFDNAQTKAEGGRLEEFSGPFKYKHASSQVTLTFEEHTVTFSVPKEDSK